MFVTLNETVEEYFLFFGANAFHVKAENEKLITANLRCLSSLVGNLRSYDGNCNENVTLKLNFALSLLRLFRC